jgi:hypothetical protein
MMIGRGNGRDQFAASPGRTVSAHEYRENG